MDTILDHTMDLSGVETHRLTSIYQPPDFVKAADHERLHGDPESLPSHVYGDAQNRLYPVHSAAATWMSTLFLMDKKGELDPKRAELIEKKIDETAAYFGVKGEIDKLKEKMAGDANDDLARVPDKDFALVWVTDVGKERHYPLRNAMEVKTASEWFSQYKDQFVFEDRHQIASKILDRAEEYGAMVHDREQVQKTAGIGYCPASYIVDALEKRAALANQKHPDYAEQMDKVANQLTANPPGVQDVGFRIKLAGLMDQFDRQTGLVKLWDDGLERPEEILFQVTEKAAADFVSSHVSLTTGSVYEKTALEGLALNEVREWMGDEFADEVAVGGVMVDTEKLATIAATLPRGDAEMFDKLATAAGITPFVREKAASDEGVGQEEIAALAADYEKTRNPLDPSLL